MTIADLERAYVILYFIDNICSKTLIVDNMSFDRLHLHSPIQDAHKRVLSIKIREYLPPELINMYSSASLAVANEGGVSNKSLTSLAFDQIRTDILKGKLKPEERLRINSLAERYKVGATAIREALSRLVTSGFVQSEDQRGFSVAAVSRAELLDLTQTRIEIESLALEKAIASGDIEWESNVISAFHRLSKFDSVHAIKQATEGWSHAHQQFHASLLKGCNSRWLLEIAGILYERSERYRNLSLLQSESQSHNLLAEERARDVLSEHRALMQAAIDRDTVLAKELLAKHFQSTTQIILNAERDVLAQGRWG